MTDDSPFQDRMRKAADGAVLTFVARWAMVVTLPLGGFIGAAVWQKLDKASDSVTRLEASFSALIDHQLPDLKSSIANQFSWQDNRLSDHERRLGRLEDWRNTKTVQ